LFDRFLIMYNLCVFTCIIFIFVFHCTHVRMSYVLNSYLLTTSSDMSAMCNVGGQMGSAQIELWVPDLPPGLGFLPTTSPTRDETRRIDGSVHDV